MCSVGVVVITSALHAVGHGFETHTEYFFNYGDFFFGCSPWKSYGYITNFLRRIDLTAV